MIVFKICFKVFKNIWLWGFYVCTEVYKIHVFKISKSSTSLIPFIEKFFKISLISYYLLMQAFVPTTSLQSFLSRLPMTSNWLNQLSMFHHHFSWSLSHIWHSGPFHSRWNPFLSWFPFSFILYMVLFSIMALKHVCEWILNL